MICPTTFSYLPTPQTFYWYTHIIFSYTFIYICDSFKLSQIHCAFNLKRGGGVPKGQSINSFLVTMVLIWYTWGENMTKTNVGFVDHLYMAVGDLSSRFCSITQLDCDQLSLMDIPKAFFYSAPCITSVTRFMYACTCVDGKQSS